MDATTAKVDELREIVKSVVYDNVLDLVMLTRFAAKGRVQREVTLRVAALQRGLIDYLRHLMSIDFGAELIGVAFPQRSFVRTNSGEFEAVVTELAATLENPDKRVLYWYAKRLRYQRIILHVPFKTVSSSVIEHRQALLRLREGPSSPPHPPLEQKRKTKMAGQTFDLYDGDPTGRVIYQYWVYDPKTDAIHAEGSLICKGDTQEEATRDLKSKLREKLAAVANPNLKMHVMPVTAFRRHQEPEGDPVAAALKDLADVIRNK